MSEVSNFLPSGTLLHGGQYRIESHVASGGFGNTYLATDVNLKAKVAIKEFYIKMINYREGDSRTVGVSNSDNLEMFHSLREKFKKEAQRIFKIQHNNVVRVYSLFEEYSTVYYAMEFIEGESLNSLLKREGALPESLVRSVFSQMLDALDVVHQAGLLHLDIKPHNIMMTANGVAKLIDFGASKHANQAEATTLTGFAFTPEYAPPELTNQEYDEIGAWTDIYSLGITLYRLLSNSPIPSKKDIRVNGADAFVYSRPVSEAMKQLILIMTQGASERRPQSVTQLKTLAMQLDSQAVPLTQPLPSSQPENEATVVLELELKPKPSVPETRSFMVNGVKFTMIAVQGGTFTMGTRTENKWWHYFDVDVDEKPAHPVTLSSFLIGQTEVTQEWWQAVMGNNPSWFKGAKHPVENVSWDDCQEFIRKLNSLTGQKFRLPTEAEWEFAARGGNRSQGYKYSGSNEIDGVAWYYGNSGGQTHEHDVAIKQHNELGLYDMSGNVWEWCQDWYDEKYYSSSPSSNPTGPASGSYRVLRGGSWSGGARLCRVASRFRDDADFRATNLGLRLAL